MFENQTLFELITSDIAAKKQILAAAAGPRRDRSRFKAAAWAMPRKSAAEIEAGWRRAYAAAGETAEVQSAEPCEFADSDYSPWELAQLDHERHADLVEVAGHEARHAVTGLALGADVLEIHVSPEKGRCHFAGIPDEYDAEITLSGSLWVEGSIWGERARGDMKFLDLAIAKKNPAAVPYSDAWHARYELAECRVNDILAEQHSCYAALKSHLVKHGHASREEVAQLWNTYGR